MSAIARERIKARDEIGEGVEHGVGPDGRPFEVAGPELAGAHEDALHAGGLAAVDVRLEVVADDRRLPGRDAERGERVRRRTSGAGLPTSVAFLPEPYSSAAAKAPMSSIRPSLCLQ